MAKEFWGQLKNLPLGTNGNNLSINKDNNCNVLKHIKYI